MNRLDLERDYWNAAALDPEVDSKYICDLPTDKCLEELGPLNGRVLEIGCGVGRLLPKGGYGVDISENMLYIAALRRPDCDLRITDGDLSAYGGGFFDKVYSVLVFQHLKPTEIRLYMKEAFRVLKAGGWFVFQFIPGEEREPFSNHYDAKELDAWLCRAGFRVIIWRDSEVHPEWMWMEAQK